MKENRISAILATLSTPSGVLAIVLIAHSQQIVTIDACSANAFPYTALSLTNSLNDFEHRYNFTFRLPKNAVPGTHTAQTDANYLGTPVSRNTPFSVVQLSDLNGDGAVNLKDIVIFASDYIAYYSSIHIYTRAIGFNDGRKMNFKGITLLVRYCIICWSA
jgi:hypothetical protein